MELHCEAAAEGRHASGEQDGLQRNGTDIGGFQLVLFCPAYVHVYISHNLKGIVMWMCGFPPPNHMMHLFALT